VAVQNLYVLCSRESFPECVLALVDQLVAAELTSYFLVNFQERKLIVVSSSKDCLPPDFQETAHQHFSEHPVALHHLQTGDGSAYKISDFLSESALQCLEGVYQKFLRPMGMADELAMTLTPIPPVEPTQRQADTVVLSLCRSKRNFQERERTLLNLLRPHLFQAYQNVQLWARRPFDLNVLGNTLNAVGIIIVSAEGQLSLMTLQAERFLERYFPDQQREHHGLPEVLRSWIQQRLVHREVSEPPSPHWPLCIGDQDSQLIARFVGLVDQLGEHYLVLLEERATASPSLERLKTFGLSPRETVVLSWAIQGKSSAEIGRILCLSAGTVRKHLEHIYQKLGVQNRVALVKCVLEKLGLI
jgi:DNA-binding CsgD family transcriptional regulator